MGVGAPHVPIHLGNKKLLVPTGIDLKNCTLCGKTMIRAAHVGSFPRQPKEMPELLRQLLKVLQGRHHRASRLLHQYMAIAAQCDNQNQYQPCCNPKIRSLHTHGMHTHGIVLCFHYYIHCGTQHKTMSISKRRIG